MSCSNLRLPISCSEGSERPRTKHCYGAEDWYILLDVDWMTLGGTLTFKNLNLEAPWRIKQLSTTSSFYRSKFNWKLCLRPDATRT